VINQIAQNKKELGLTSIYWSIKSTPKKAIKIIGFGLRKKGSSEGKRKTLTKAL